VEDLVFLLQSTFDKEFNLALVNLELHLQLFVCQQEAEQQLVSLKQCLTDLGVEYPDKVSLQASNGLFFALLGRVVDDGLRHELAEETYEPFVSELVHVVQFHQVVRYEEELSRSLTDGLVKLASLHEYLH